MIRLRPMNASEYEIYLERAINEYADEKVMAGNWHPSEALELSRQEYQRLLPDGPATPRQHLFTIALDNQPGSLGMIWFAEIDQALQPYAFIYDFYIDEPFRRMGYGAEAMLKSKTRSAPADSIASVCMCLATTILPWHCMKNWVMNPQTSIC